MPRFRLRRPALNLGHHPRLRLALYGSVALLALLIASGSAWWARQPTIWSVPGAISIALSPDGTLLAIGCRAADDSKPAMIEIRRVADGSLVHRYPAPAIIPLRFSPDGTLLAGTSRSAAWVWRVADGTVVQHWGGYYELRQIAWSADGARLAIAKNSLIEIRQVVDGQLLRRIEPIGYWSQDIAFSPDGETLVSAGSNSLSLWRVADGQHRVRFGERQGQPSVVAWSADGHYLAVGSSHGETDLWDMRQPVPRLERTLTTSYPMHVSSVAFSPDGQRVAASGGPSTSPMFSAIPLTLREIVQTIEINARRPQIEIWSTVDGTRLQRLRNKSWGIFNSSWTPDGRHLISNGEDTIYLWRPR